MRGDKKENPDLIYGVRAVIEAVKANKEINKIFIQKGMNKELFYELKDALANKKYVLKFVPKEKLDRLTQKKHQGVAALLSPVSYVDLVDMVENIYEKGEAPLLIVLDRVTDVRNFGSIARSAECLGAHAIVVPKNEGVTITADAIKTSAGALHSVPVARVDDLSDTLLYLKDAGLQVVACTEKTDISVSDAGFDGPCAVVMGAEDTGISRQLLEIADVKCKIPMTGKIASLNVAVSAAIVMHEIQRQRN